MKYLKSKKGSLENSILGVWKEAATKVKEGSKEEYQKFFNSALKKFKIDSPADLKTDAKKKEFFNYVDKNYKAKAEEVESNLQEKERTYTVVHIKKGKEIIKTSKGTYDAAKKYAKMKGLKSTAGVDVHLMEELDKEDTPTVKKVVKSPLGKAALTGAMMFGMPGTSFGGLLGRAKLGGAASGIFGNTGGIGALLGQGGKFSTLGDLFRVGGEAGAKFSVPRILGGLAAGSAIAAPLFMGEEAVTYTQPFTMAQPMIEDVRSQAKKYYSDPTNSALYFMPPKSAVRSSFYAADGGLADIPREGYAEGGIMDLGGMEKDYRAEGGFVPIGREEKADDVPARLSVNEFVFTADAVRNAGGGDIDKGAEVMENMMKHLEQGGQVSEESQGMVGARDMFATSQRLSEVI